MLSHKYVFISRCLSSINEEKNTEIMDFLSQSSLTGINVGINVN